MAEPFSMKFKFTSKEAEKIIPNLAPQLRRIVNEAVKAIGKNIEERAKKLAPIDEGDLRSAIKATAVEDAGGISQIMVEAEVPYALKMHEAFYTARRSPEGGRQPIEPNQPEGPIGRRYISRVIEHEPNRKRYELALARAIKDNIGKLGKIKIIELPKT